MKYNRIWPKTWYQVFDTFLPLKRCIFFSGYPLNRGAAYQPFFIVGSGRSGNTLLRRMLYAHYALHIPPETFVLGDTIRLFRQYRNMNWDNLVHFTLSQFEFYPEFDTFEMSLRPLVQRLSKAPENIRSLAYILDSFYRYHAETKGVECRRWGDKTPLNTFVLERILSVFPDAQFIHMIRDGVDVVLSYLEANIAVSNMDSAAYRWLASIEAVRQFTQRHPQLCFELRYEMLVREPKESISKVCNYLGIEFDESMLNSHGIAQDMGDVARRLHHKAVWQPISPDSIGKGRLQFSKAQKQRLQELIGDELIRLGYEPVI